MAFFPIEKNKLFDQVLDTFSKMIEKAFFKLNPDIIL